MSICGLPPWVSEPDFFASRPGPGERAQSKSPIVFVFRPMRWVSNPEFFGLDGRRPLRTAEYQHGWRRRSWPAAPTGALSSRYTARDRPVQAGASRRQTTASGYLRLRMFDADRHSCGPHNNVRPRSRAVPIRSWHWRVGPHSEREDNRGNQGLPEMGSRPHVGSLAGPDEERNPVSGLSHSGVETKASSALQRRYLLRRIPTGMDYVGCVGYQIRSCSRSGGSRPRILSHRPDRTAHNTTEILPIGVGRS
jgi:hypothetical protein